MYIIQGASNYIKQVIYNSAWLKYQEKFISYNKNSQGKMASGLTSCSNQVPMIFLLSGSALLLLVFLMVARKLLQFIKLNADITTSRRKTGIASSHEFIFKTKDIFSGVPQQTSLHVSFARRYTPKPKPITDKTDHQVGFKPIRINPQN